MTPRWQISAAGIDGWLPPLLYAFAVLASAWVLHGARRRRFPPYAVAAWTLATLAYAPVVLPLYLAARMFKPSPAEANDAPASDAVEAVDVEAVDDAAETNAPQPLEAGEAADSEETVAAKTDAARGATTREQTSGDAGEQAAAAIAVAPPALRPPFPLKRYAPSLLYALALLSAGAVYFYRDYHSFDAHLARAAAARLLNRRDAAIREYRAALRINDDAHTHKLLAVQLAEGGQAEAALAELRAAERGGEPDELLALRVAAALDALGRAGEAVAAYEKFLESESCARPSPAPQCADAGARLRQIRGGVEAR